MAETNQCCGTCKYYQPQSAKEPDGFTAGTCYVPIPSWIPSAVIIDEDTVHSAYGSACPAYQKGEGE